MSAAFLCVSISWEWGHVAATGVAAAVGAAILGAAGRRHSDELAAAAYGWLGVVLVEALVFDVGEFADELNRSVGGWSVIVAAAGLLGGAYVHRLWSPSAAAYDVLLAVAAGFAAACHAAKRLSQSG